MIGSVLGLALFFLKSIHNLVSWVARPYALCSKGALVASYHNLSLSKDWRDPLWPINASPNSKVVLFVGHCVWRNGEGGGSIVPPFVIHLHDQHHLINLFTRCHDYLSTRIGFVKTFGKAICEFQFLFFSGFGFSGNFLYCILKRWYPLIIRKQSRTCQY